MVKYRIVNVVVTASLNQELDFYEVAKLRDIFYDSDVYGGRVAYLKTNDMSGRVAIFSSGKMISVGTTSERKASEELQFAKKYLIDNGFINDIEMNPKTQNIVVTVDLENSINLEELASRAKGKYEPKLFPGVILRLEKPKVSALVFASGKIVIAGLKDSEQIVCIIKNLQKIILDKIISCT